MSTAEQTLDDYAPTVGATALDVVFGGASDSRAPVALASRTLRDGLLAACVRAELLAAQAGVVPWVELPGGERGVAVIGGARAKIAGAPDDVRLPYLAVHGATTYASAAAVRGRSDDERIDHVPGIEGLCPSCAGDTIGNPIVIGLVVVGVVAAIATAWWAHDRSLEVVRTEGQSLRAAQSTAALADLARGQLATTGRIDPSLVESIAGLGRAESREGWAVPLAIGVVGTTAAGLAVWGFLRRGGAG